MPDFVVLGAMKAGSTALYRYITDLPDVAPAFKKEIQYFSYRYDRGELWYRSHFPLRARLRRDGAVTGEASPSYLFHRAVPERLARDLPDARLIAILRNPVERAYSHYAYERARNMEPLQSFADALEQEERRLAEPTPQEAGHRRAPWRVFSYKARGLYADQLERWFAVCGRERILVIQSEQLMREPASVMPQVADWVGARYATPTGGFPKHNVGTYESKIEPDVLTELVRFFKPHNERLYELLGTRFDWS